MNSYIVKAIDTKNNCEIRLGKFCTLKRSRFYLRMYILQEINIVNRIPVGDEYLHVQRMKTAMLYSCTKF